MKYIFSASIFFNWNDIHIENVWRLFDVPLSTNIHRALPLMEEMPCEKNLFYFRFIALYFIKRKKSSFLTWSRYKEWKSDSPGREGERDCIITFPIRLCKVIGTAISLPGSKLKRRCVRSASNTITFAGKTYEISKLGKHLPLQKSYKLLPRKLFRDYSPSSAKRFQSCLSARSKFRHYRNNPFLSFKKQFAPSNLQF